MHTKKWQSYIYALEYAWSVKTDLIQYNKKINFDVHNKRRIILLEEICFPSAISVFSKCFEIKYSWNLLGSIDDLAMVTFCSCTDTRQISAAPNSRRYVILLVPYWKMISFERNELRFFVRKPRCFLPHLHFLANANAVCWQYIIIPRQRDPGCAMIFFYQYCFFISNSSFFISTLKIHSNAIHSAFFAASIFSILILLFFNLNHSFLIRIFCKQYKLEGWNFL